MAGVLSPEHRPGLRHHLLDERVTDPRPYGDAAVLADHLRDRPRADEFVDDRGSGVPLQHRLGDERRDERAAHVLRLLVDEEHPVGVAVEREPDVRALLQHGSLEVALVLRVDRVRGMVREGPVELGEEVDELEGQPLEDRGHDESPHPVRRVRDDLERLHRGNVDERQDVLDVGVEHALPVDGPGRLARRAPGKLRERADVAQSGLLSDRRRAGATELQPVPLGRVVTRGEHDARELEGAGDEVQEIGRGEPDVEDVRAPVGRTGPDGLCERLRGEPAVVADRDARSSEPLGERSTDPVGHLLVEVLRHDAADVVRLEDPAEIPLPAHDGCESYRPACVADRGGGGAEAVALGLRAHDETDDALQRHGLTVAVPPLGFAEVARREREVAAVHAHRDGDQLSHTAGGTGPLWRVVHGDHRPAAGDLRP